MITDRGTLQLIRGVNRRLEEQLRRCAEFQDNGNIELLEDSQIALKEVRAVVDGLCSALDNSAANTQVRKIDYGRVQRALKRLPALQDAAGPLQAIVVRSVHTYATILCYYTAVSVALAGLSPAYTACTYYTGLLESPTYTMLYGLQTLPAKIMRLSKDLRERAQFAQPEVLWNNLTKEFTNHLETMLMVNRFQFVGLPKRTTSWALNACITPLLFVKKEIQDKCDLYRAIAKEITERLGQLLMEFEQSSSLLIMELNPLEAQSSLADFYQADDRDDLNSIVEYAKLYQDGNNDFQILRKPSKITRYWPMAFLVTLYGPALIHKIWSSRDEIARFLSDNVVDFTRGLIVNWIWEPLKKIWATVRHDDGESVMLTTKENVQSEQDSLIRMVVSFTLDNSMGPTLNKDALISQIENGDLTQFMEIYEGQLNHPLKNILTGKLIRSLLIQLQKTKVDGSVALNGIDKMLRSQELVFGVVAMSPALLIGYILLQLLKSTISYGKAWSNVQEIKYQIKVSLNNVERILNYSTVLGNENLSDFQEGLMALEASTLAQLGTKLIPKRLHHVWIQEIEALLRRNSGLQDSMYAVNRIHHTFDPYI